MKIGFFTSWDERCGIAEYSRLLVSELRERVELEVVSATFRKSPPAVYAAMGRALSAADVIHIQHSYAFFGGMHPLRSGWAAFARELRRPVVLTVHELDLRATGLAGLPAPLEVAYKRWFNRRVLLHPQVRYWMVHSRVLREQLVSLGAAAERVVYAPMPLQPPPPVPDPSALRRRLRLEGCKALVIPGFLARRKGYDVALEALSRLPQEYVLVAAGGEHAADRTGAESWLRAEAERRGVADRLRLTGFLSEAELDQAVALAHLVLAPFREMSSSASLAYALARGAAVVASDLPENRGLECVRLFPTGDGVALARAVRELDEDAGARLRLSAAAREYAERHTYRSLAQKTVELYRQSTM